MTPLKLQLVASQPHYLDHLAPIFAALPEHVKGHGVNLVAGFADVREHPTAPYILVEHGTGQSYVGISADGYYSGGSGHNLALGFICPNEEVSRRWLTRYPDKPSAVVGCPRLDAWHSGARGNPEGRTVALTFHWDAQHTGVPETTSAFYWYFESLFDVVLKWRHEGWTVLGHWHPRYPAVGQFWERLNREIGIEIVADSAEILDRASILVADNTSMQAEFLSLGRRVVWLNHPGYRRDVQHGGRFWTWPKIYGGTIVDDGHSLLRLDLDDVPLTTGHPYTFADGRATNRASLAIQFWLRSLEESLQ